MHRENETRVLSLTSDDSRGQTARVLRALAAEVNENVGLDEWHQFQSWLEDQHERRVVIPYAGALAGLVPPVAVRLRRDFSAVLSLIKGHALLHQLSRNRDPEGRIVASLDDYRDSGRPHRAAHLRGRRVRRLARGREKPCKRYGPSALLTPLESPPEMWRRWLNLDKSTVSRRLSVAGEGGWLDQQRGAARTPRAMAAGRPAARRDSGAPHGCTVANRGIRRRHRRGGQKCCSVTREGDRLHGCTVARGDIEEGGADERTRRESVARRSLRSSKSSSSPTSTCTTPSRGRGCA